MTTAATIQNRNTALDALRGLAILGMVFSGAFPHEIPWPGWMFHAQVGPPDFTYQPGVPGITWVDLVFPFFLFSMGAAIPLSLSGRIQKQPATATAASILKRFLLLALFAIAIRHLNPYLLKGPLWFNHLTALLTFGAFFLIYMPSAGVVRKIAGWGMVVALGGAHQLYFNLNFSPDRSDIIILVLANMALFASFLWWITRERPLLRFAVLAGIAGIRLAHDVPDSWNEALFHFHPSVSWLYRFDFLKYLFIVLPGTFLGDRLLKDGSDASREMASVPLAWISAALVLVNLYGLYTRSLLLNLALSILLIVAGTRLQRNTWFVQGACWLLVGLCFEAFDGGIKKDPSSFSYWFVTTGLAWFTYLVLEKVAAGKRRASMLVSCGRNPMVAYVAGSFLVWPVLDLSGIKGFIDSLREYNVYLGIVKTFLLTGSVMLVTSFTVEKKWFWKT